MDRGKPGTKHRVAVDRWGIPLAAGIIGATRHDDTVFEALVEAIPLGCALICLHFLQLRSRAGRVMQGIQPGHAGMNGTIMFSPVIGSK